VIHHDLEQRSPEWHRLRLGIPCSSEFHKIVTPKKLELSSQAKPLMWRLLAEWVTGAPVEEAFQSFAMERGTELEDQAVGAYEMLTGRDTQRAGFITSDDGMMGCSPDRLIGTAGDLELKCPLIHTQIGRALEGLDQDYVLQLQGRMLIHGREWCELFSYHPLLVIPPLRVYRDEKVIGRMQPILAAFVETLLKSRALLEEKYGPFKRNDDAPPQSDDIGPLGVTEEDAAEIWAAYEKEMPIHG
jgi:hypothetical protein